MRLLLVAPLLLLLGTGCAERGQPAPPAEPNSPANPAVPTIPADAAAASVDAVGSVDAATLADEAEPIRTDPVKPLDPRGVPPPLPTELSAAPQWIGRTFDTGLITFTHIYEIHTLRRHGLQAALTIQRQIAGTGGGLSIGPWSAEPTKYYLGTAAQQGNVVTLALANVEDPTDRINLPCKLTKLAAARNDAVRRNSSSTLENCGDEGRWHPAVTKRIDVLHCRADENPSAPHLAFAPSPGIEWLFVNDDCLQGGGWRQVRADHAIVLEVRHRNPDAGDKPSKPSKP
ncbi:MAG: hypothetical protein H0T89_20260 [Deltaproteobacteria bacterium]|nr:hypothetical protein [Deltaproteobacteria bacterium]